MSIVHRGFTILELTLAVLIVGMLSATAVPEYQSYATRSKIVEGLSVVATAKLAVGETYHTLGSLPGDNSQAGLPPLIASNYVDSVTVGNAGEITIDYNVLNVGILPGEDTIVLRPLIGNGSIEWECTGGTVINKFRPRECRI